MVKKLLKAIKQNFLYEQSNITFKMIVFGYKRLSKMLFQFEINHINFLGNVDILMINIISAIGSIGTFIMALFYFCISFSSTLSNEN